jgi:tetratricopeptide (TPR) repeat protein
MPTTAEALSVAVAHHQAGRLLEAEQLYWQILASAPQCPEAWHFLGVIAHQTGRNELAVETIGRAIALRPNYGEAHSNLGVVFKALNRLEDALASYNRALALEPNAAETINNLGTVFQAQGRLADAVTLYKRALELKPNYAEAHNNLGLAFDEQGKIEEAQTCYRRALAAFPNYSDAHNNLGHALDRLGKSAEAIACFQRALALNPQFAEAYNNLGAELQEQAQLDEAEASFRKALEREPDLAAAHVNLSFLLLLRGDFQRGWQEFEWRWKYKKFRGRAPNRRAWNGSSVAGRTVLLHTEQGFGDAFQFVRYAPLVNQMGANVIVHSPTGLKRLLQSCPGVEQVIGDDEPLPPFHEHASVLSLPLVFKTDLPTIPANVPYLFADAALVEHWKAKLAAIGGFRIGINWQGRGGIGDFRLRDIPLALMATLTDVPGVRLINLQRGDARRELLTAADRLPIIDLGDDIDREAGAFMDTAAIMKNLDLVITSDTAVAHLAGALGVPVWVGLPFVPNWRWLLRRSDCPWYPTMRLYRQPSPGDWSDVLEKMKTALALAAVAT